MKNYVQRGDTLTLTALDAVSSGDVVVIGSIIGVAAGDAAEGEPVDVGTVGVFDLPKVSAEAIDEGDPVYWDADDSLVTGTATDNTKLGVAVQTAGNPSASVRVRLSGAF